MRESRKIIQPAQPERETTEYYDACDNCRTEIKEYGRETFKLEQKIGEFRDNPGESTDYVFCCWKCLTEFIRKKKPAGCATAELQDNEDYESFEKDIETAKNKIKEIEKENKELKTENTTLKSAIEIIGNNI